jgi:hypothetical protein
MATIDLAGQRVGRLTVVAGWGRDRWGQAKWLCLCDCGEYAVVATWILRNGRSKSCGCLQRDLARVRTPRLNHKHGMSGTELYRLWNSVMQRCSNEKQINYERYGGRGITVCDQWAKDFTEFSVWAQGNGYKKGLQIDRKDNNAGYSPENCHFVTVFINNNNTRRSRRWIVLGRIFGSATDASLFFNVDRKTIRNWCLGDRQHKTPPKPGCYAPRLYGGE